jgi:hypothetical protein
MAIKRVWIEEVAFHVVCQNIWQTKRLNFKTFFGSRGSEVQILSPRPFKTMGYGLDRSPFFIVGNTMGNK